MRALVLIVAAALLAGGCSGDSPPPAASAARAEETLKRNCADPQWREQNLGLWYSVCRQPVRW